MPSLRLAARSGAIAGEPIGDAFPTLTALEVQLTRGSLHVLASAPGGGKTVTAINWAIKAKVPTLYFFLDDTEVRALTRFVQAAQMLDRHTAREQIESNGLLARQVFDTIDWVRPDFPSAPDMEEIRDRVWAFGEIYGEFPHLIVVDNLMDIVEDEDTRSYREAEKNLALLAKAANAAVLTLAHVTGQYESGHDTVPMSGLNFKPSKKPSLVLSSCRGQHPDEMFVSVLKNRDGPADPSGVGVRAKLTVDYSRMSAS